MKQLAQHAFYCLLALPFAMGTAGCDDPGATIVVDLVSDYVPSVHFSRARIFLTLPGGDVLVQEHQAQTSGSYLRGLRVAQFADLEAGEYQVRVEITTDNGRVVGHRANIGHVGEGLSPFTLNISQNCQHVECPNSSPRLSECSGGRCVSPECSAENPAACEPGCTADLCESPVACAAGICTAEGACLFGQVGGTCDSAEYCDLELGCTPVPPGGLLDASVDMGTDSALDANTLPDMSTDDAGPDMSIDDAGTDTRDAGPDTFDMGMDAGTDTGMGASGGTACAESRDCRDGERCVGRPMGFPFGKCHDITMHAGYGGECRSDRDCDLPLVCIGLTTGGNGSCAEDWMRDTFYSADTAPIPAVVMTTPLAFRATAFGQATVPIDVVVEIDMDHTDPSSLLIQLKPPTGQPAVTLWDGSTDVGPLPSRFVDTGVERDNSVNGEWQLWVQSVGGRGTGVVRGFSIFLSSRWD